MSAPWMPLYVADYLADTGHLNAAEHGAYMLLIMHYWRTGGLPADEGQLQRIARMSGAEWKRSRDTLAAFFNDDWTHDRIEQELSKSTKKSEARAGAGSRGGQAKAERAKALKTNKPNVANATILLEQKDAVALASSSLSLSDIVSLRSTMACVSANDGFATWYGGYPHKVGRSDAEKAFRKIVAAGTVALDTLVEGVERYRRTKPPDRSWCNPATWLNGERWKDRPAEVDPRGPNFVRNGPGPPGSTGVLLDAAGEIIPSADEPRDPFLRAGRKYFGDRSRSGSGSAQVGIDAYLANHRDAK